MGGGIWPVEMDGRPRNRADETASLRFVTSDHFAALGIPILRGRDVSTSDRQDRAYVAVVIRVIGAFAALAIVLAAIGMHGLLSFTVTHRAREIGVRIALGADRRGILMVLREGLPP